MNKNQKYSLNVSIENNEELNKSIDSLIRARVQNIVRQESEAFLEQEIVKKAKAIIMGKAENLTEATIERWGRQIIRDSIISQVTFNSAITDYVNEHFNDFTARIDNVINREVERKLSSILPIDVIKIVTKAIASNKETV